MLAEEMPRDEIINFSYINSPVNYSIYAEKKKIAVEKFQNQDTN
jgi:hypothetical protein